MIDPKSLKIRASLLGGIRDQDILHKFWCDTVVHNSYTLAFTVIWLVWQVPLQFKRHIFIHVSSEAYISSFEMCVLCCLRLSFFHVAYYSCIMSYFQNVSLRFNIQICFWNVSFNVLPLIFRRAADERLFTFHYSLDPFSYLLSIIWLFSLRYLSSRQPFFDTKYKIHDNGTVESQSYDTITIVRCQS